MMTFEKPLQRDAATIDAFDQLALTAEVSVTLLGFIAVFLVLSNEEGRFAESDRHFIQALVISSSVVIFSAFVPRGLSFFFLGEVLWMTSLIVMVVVGTVAMAFQGWIQLKMSPEEAAHIHWGWHAIAWGLGLIASAMIVIGLLGYADKVGMFVGATTVIAILALWSFVSVVFRKFF